MADNLVAVPASGGKLSKKDVLKALQSWAYLPSQPRECSRPAEHYLAGWQEGCSPDKWLENVISEPCAEGLWLAGVNKLAWDTEFFGFGMGRLLPLVNPGGVNSSRADLHQGGKRLLEQVLRHAAQINLEHLSVLVHPQDTVTQSCLQQAGFMLRDTTVRYRLSLSKPALATTNSKIRKATAEDADSLAAIAGGAFGSRRHNVNRFNSDPRFSETKVAQLYQSWVRNSLTGQLADAVFVYEENGKILGFITVQLPSAIDLHYGINLCHIPLNAVDVEYQGQGIYSRLVDYALEWCRHQGVDYVEIWTQLANAGVHRCWSKRGAVMVWSCHAFHWSAAG